MRLIPFNVNWNMRVKLNKSGLDELQRRHEEFRKLSPRIGEFNPPVDVDCYYRAQAWVIMEELGHLITMGVTPPFETKVLLEIEDPPAQRTINKLRERLDGLREACYANRTLHPNNVAMLCEDVINMLDKLHA